MKTLARLFPLLVLVIATTAEAQTQELQNPLAFGDISSAIAGFLRAVVMVALPIISLFIVYSGFLFVRAQGNPEQLATARKNLLWVIIGTILILGAWVIATLIGGTVTQILRG